MKNISLLSFFFILFVFNSFGQNPIPNPSFENNWIPYTGTNITFGSFSGEYPSNWETTDSVLQHYTAPRSAIKELTDKCEGNYALKLISVSAFSNRAPGAATNGHIDPSGFPTISYYGGTPTTRRWAFFEGCYKFVPAGSDTALLTAILFKRNGASRDTIAISVDTITAATSVMTPFTKNFFYLDNTRNPDSILVLLQSGPGLNRVTAGTSLTVDTVDVGGNVPIGINELNPALKEVSLYPLPASSELTVDVTYNTYKKTFFELSDETGRIVMKGEMNGNRQKLNTGALSGGLYMMTLRDENGEKLYSGRISVMH